MTELTDERRMVMVRAAQARATVTLRDGRRAVLIYFPPPPDETRGQRTKRARVKLPPGYHEAIDPDEIVAVVDDTAPPAWIAWERLRTLLRLHREQGDPNATKDLDLLEKHVPKSTAERCFRCGDAWPCPTIRKVGDARAFHWS